MFWKYSHLSSPQIDTLLNKDDVTLQELMDEEDVLQECKVQNKKLIDFLIRPEVMEELVRLTTMEPSTDLDERLRYKYPNIACELLTCEVPALNERLAGDEELLGKLYTFLESESPLNPLLATFFSKTFGVLVARKSQQNWYSYQFTCLQVLEFLKSKENFIALLLKHLGTSAIMDLLLKLITHIEGVEMKQNILNWLDSQQVIQCLIGLLDPSVDAERNSNAAQLLSDVIKISRDYQQTAMEKTDPDPILNRLESPETVTLLLDHVLGTEKHQSSIIGGITVLLTLLESTRPNTEPSADGNNMYSSGDVHQEEPTENEQTSRVLLTTLNAILPRLKDFHNLLLEPPYKPPVKTTAGVFDPPVGKTRLQIATLMTALISTNNTAINNELAELDTINVLLDMFFKYTWNNFLHAQVEQCIAYALVVDVVAEPSGEDSNSNILLKNIFIKCRLIQRILQAWNENETHETKPGGLRCGYMGHLVKIANAVATQAEKGPLGLFIKEHVPPETVTAWETFVANTLAEINKTRTICLGGGAHPGHSSSEDDDPEYRDIPFCQEIALQQAYNNYQMEQAAPQYIENYGFNDEEFADSEDVLHTSVDRLTSMTFNLSETDLDKQAEMFKKVCAKKINTLDGDDENVWDDQELTFQTVIETRTSGWQSATEGPGDSSDEEEREGPEGREEIHMEVDSTDPWESRDLTNEVVAAPIAVDVDNPWNTPTATTTDTNPEQNNWADFGSAGFADFESNFSSSENSRGADKSEETITSPSPAENTTETASVLTVVSEDPPGPTEELVSNAETVPMYNTTPGPEQADDSLEPNVKSDDNANPSSSSGAEELIDNYRFLSNRGCLSTSPSGDAEAVPEDDARPEATENGPISPSATPLSIGDVLTPPKGKSLPECAPSAVEATPNGPV